MQIILARGLSALNDIQVQIDHEWGPDLFDVLQYLKHLSL